MKGYILQRLILLPLTLIAIVFVNFIIINLAPGDPVYLVQSGVQGEASHQVKGTLTGPEDCYLQFRHFFGLTLPLLYNDWPLTTKKELVQALDKLKMQSLNAKEYAKLRIELSDRARYSLFQFLEIAKDPKQSLETRKFAVRFFIRGATAFSHIGPNLTESEKLENETIAQNNLFLERFRSHEPKDAHQLDEQIELLSDWFIKNEKSFFVPTSGPEFWKIALFETRIARYFERTLSLDFGVLRNDPNKTVMSEVVSRLKISLALSIIPMLVTFLLCQVFGMLMSIYSNSYFDRGVNLVLLMLWAIPVFVAGPFLIEKVALYHNYPLTNLPFPIRGFSSVESVYSQLTSWQRLEDIFRHITLPLITIFYGIMAVQTRLARAVFHECLQQDYVKCAKAKGVRPLSLYLEHVGRNAAIPIITSLAGSLGLILGGSVIVETIFDIHGFGKFFYEAILNRDYNVMMFSTLVGSFLGLVGYLVADISYMVLDPRVAISKSGDV